MMNIKEVRKLVDSKLKDTGYMRAGGGRNYKRKDYRVFKICVIHLGAGVITNDDFTAIENLLNGIAWFYEGCMYVTQFKRNITHSRELVMCFEWKIAL